jgi:hypothetical protein
MNRKFLKFINGFEWPVSTAHLLFLTLTEMTTVAIRAKSSWHFLALPIALKLIFPIRAAST